MGGVEVERSAIVRRAAKSSSVIWSSQPPMILSFRLSLLMPWAGSNSSGCSKARSMATTSMKRTRLMARRTTELFISCPLDCRARRKRRTKLSLKAACCRSSRRKVMVPRHLS